MVLCASRLLRSGQSVRSFRTPSRLRRPGARNHAQTYALCIVCWTAASVWSVACRDVRAADDPDGMRIATVSRLLGVPVPTIRSWERRYEFPAPPRTDGLHRRYGEVELAAAARATRSGDEGAQHTRCGGTGTERRGGPVRGWVPFRAGRRRCAGARHRATSGRARRINRAAGRRGHHPPGNPAGDARDRRAVEGRPVRRRARALCHRGAFAAWLARQAFLAPPPFRPHPIVLACGPQDLHTIGLESFAVILARRGWPCRVLGARTPTEALVSAVQAWERSVPS